MNARRWVFAIGQVAAAVGLGGLGARHPPQIYRRLRKPRWAPPAGAFGPVWSALYAGIGAAGWRLSGSASRRSRSLHLTQLALNAAWPAVFFSARDKRALLLIIGLLDAVVAAEILTLRRADPVAASLLVPYRPGSALPRHSTLPSSKPGEPARPATTRAGLIVQLE